MGLLSLGPTTQHGRPVFHYADQASLQLTEIFLSLPLRS